MKIFAFLSLFFLALPVTVNAQKELLKFEHPLIDAGTMTEDDAPRTFTFVGKNVSKKILHITQVRTTCGCTSSYVRGDVMKPGDTCQVQITFTPNRYPGTINTGAYLSGKTLTLDNITVNGTKSGTGSVKANMSASTDMK